MKDIKGLNLDDLTNLMGNCEPGSVRHGEAMAELERRRFLAERETGKAQERAAIAQEKAANAAIETAGHAERNAKYMLWSVFAATASAFISLVSTAFTLYFAYKR
jgi:multidrug resistance efflux pump